MSESQKFKDTFGELFDLIMTDNPERILIRYFKNGTEYTITQRDYARKVDSIAAALKRQYPDIPKGSWVAVKSPNGIYWFAVLFALMKVGYKILLIDANCGDELVEFYSKQANIAAIAAPKGKYSGDVKHIDCESISATDESTETAADWSDRIALCTSGTTGTAKIFVFTARAMINQIKNVSQYWAGCPEIIKSKKESGTVQNNILAALPFHHTYGLGIPLIIWSLGWTFCFPEKAGITGFIEGIQREKSWFAYSVPIIWKTILNIAKGKYGRADPEAIKLMFGGQFKVAITSGAHMDLETKKQLRGRA